MVELGGDEPAWMVAAHAGVAGAQRAGLRGAWVATSEREYLGAYPPPDIRAVDLADAAGQLLSKLER